MNERLKALADAGVSIWLDDLSRERITSGNLADLVSNYSVSGVTTNPTIFATALAQGHMYDEQIKELAARDADLHDAIKVLTTDDVRDACDIMPPSDVCMPMPLRQCQRAMRRRVRLHHGSHLRRLDLFDRSARYHARVDNAAGA